ncbi:MAG: lamin tail domain-containing protein [Flavobacteriales bacterium]|nr:MAG: lamin tail domain-containing protein [Flavobacteriales bacterium]
MSTFNPTPKSGSTGTRMLKRALLLAALVLPAVLWAQVNYTRSTFTGTYTPITTGGGALTAGATGDGVYTNGLPIGFNFDYNGTVYTTFGVSTDGFMSFTATTNSLTNTNLFSATAPNAVIAPWWDDLNTNAVGTNPAGSILYQTTGAPGSQVLTVQWIVSSYWSTSAGQPRLLNFQVKLYEATGDIELWYGDAIGTTTNTAESASIGLESATGGNGQYIDAVTGSRFTSNSTLQSNRWPAYNFRFTPGSAAPVAAGTYNVGVGQTYANLNEAVADLNLRGVNGAVTLNLTDDQYDATPAGGSHFFPILLGPVSGASATNTITITKSGTPAVITYDGALGSSGSLGNQASTTGVGGSNVDPIIGLVGADYVTIQNVTLLGPSGSLVDHGIGLYNSSATDGATNNTIQNVTVQMNRGNTGSRGFRMNTGTTPSSAAGANSNNTFRDFTIRNVYAGIEFSGNATWPDVNTQIVATDCNTPNSIGDPNTAFDIGGGNSSTASYGIQLTNQSGFTVNGNAIRNVSNTTGQLDGINIVAFQGTCTVANNVVRTITRNSTSSTVALTGIRATHPTTGTHALRIYNNAISEVRNLYTGTITATRSPLGIYAPTTGGANTQSFEVWNNTISIDQSANPNISSSCLEIASTATTGATWTVRNNILANYTTGQTGVGRHFGVVHSNNGTIVGATGSLLSNNAIYIADGAGTTGFTAGGGGSSLTTTPSATYNGQAAWDAASAQVGANLDDNPNLTTGLESASAALNGAGAAVPGYLTVDAACAPRQNDIGAFNINACVTPVAGTIDGSPLACLGQANALSLDGASSGLGISYQWRYGPVGGPYDDLLGTALTQSTSGLPLGSYEVVVDVICSAGPTTVTTAPFALTVNPVPTASASAGPACIGQTLQLAGTTDIGTGFTWSGPNGFNSTLQNPTIGSLTAAANGTYTFIASAAGCSSTPATVAVSTVQPPTISSVTASQNPICINSSAQLNAAATGAQPNVLISEVVLFRTGTGQTPTYPAHITGADLAELVNASTVPADISGWTIQAFASNGTTPSHSLTFAPGTVIPANGVAVVHFGSGTDNVPLLYFNTGGSSDTYFSGGPMGVVLKNGSFVIDAVGAGTSFTWNPATGVTAGDWSGVASSPSGIAGSIRTALSDNNTGADWTASSVGLPQTIGTYNNYNNPNSSPIASYAWDPVTFLDDATIANPQASNVTATTAYTVTVTNTAGCASVGNITLQANPAIGPTQAEINPDPAEFCTGGDVELTASPLGGGAPYTYTWTDPNNVTGAPSSSATQVVNIPGLWTVQIDDACGGTATASITVVENPTPTASASAGLACLGQTLQLTGTTDIGTSFAWTGPNSFASTSQNPTVNPVVPASAGTYSFVATLGDCSSAPATVTVSPQPAPIISSVTATPNPVCAGTGDVQLNVNAFVGYAGAPIAYAPLSPAGPVTPGPTGDDSMSGDVAIGFTFPFFGVNYTTLRISTNGFITFANTTDAGCCSGELLPTNDVNQPNNVIALAWEDYNTGLGGTIDYFTLTAPNRFVVRYNNVIRFGSTGALDGQIVLFEDGTVEMHIANSNTTGGDIITQGLENAAGTEAITVPGRNAAEYSITNDGYRFSLPQADYLWTPSTFLTSDVIANPVAEAPTATTAYSVLVSSTNGCESTGNVTMTVNQSPDVDLAVVQDCINSAFSISVLVNSTGNGPTVDLSYTVNGGTPVVVSGLAAGPQAPLGPFLGTDDVVVTIVDPAAGCNTTLPVFRSGCPEFIVCPNILTKTYCYENNDTRSWLFEAPPGETIRLRFVSGGMEPNDIINIYDGVDDNAPSLTAGSFANLFGVTVVSTGQSIYMVVASDGSGSCADNDPLASTWVWEVQCNPGCVDPAGSVATVLDCFEQRFSLDVGVDFVGDGATVDLEYSVNGGTPVTIPGLIDFDIQNIGPFAFGDDVEVFLRHDFDGSCDLNLGTFTEEQSACPNDEPCSAWILPMNPNYTCTATSPGNMTGATLTAGITGGCTGVVQDRWYRFTATAPTHRVQLGGTTTGLSHSIYTGTCGALTLVPGTSCVSGATASNPANLTIGEIYWVRVSRTTAGTNAYTVCVSAPPLIDVDATVLVEPLAAGCYTAAEDVIVRVLNNAIYPLDLSVNPLTVNVAVTGAATANLSGTVSTGIVAPAATIDVTMSATLDMTAAGTYTFNGSAVVAGDGNATNDGMTAANRINAATVAIPQTCNFTGFTGSNLTTVFPNFREGAGAALPAGTTSGWLSSSALGQATARINLFGTTRNEWIVGPKFVPVLGTVLQYKIAITDFASGAADPAGMQGTDDRVRVMISTDCGASYSEIFVHNAANTVGITNSLVQQQVDLSSYAGQPVIIAFLAQDGPVDNTPDYDFHLDDINITNIAVCAGAPVAGTAAGSQPGPVCAPASTNLSLTGQSTDAGVAVTWWSSTVNGGPYTTNVGSGASVTASGLTETTYFVASVKCLATNDSTLSNQVSIQVTPTPTASASAGPACTGQDLQLTGTTDFGTTFSWTGPNSFSSTDQNPLITAITTAAQGTYTFTATANGCSTQGTVAVSVNTTPVITSLTADPNPVCIGANSQLNATAPVSGYSLGSSGTSFIDISGTGTAIPGVGDDTEHNITIPGGFIFNGVNYTDARVGANGVIVFGATAGDISLTNAALPTGTVAAGNAFLAPWWDDIDNDAGGGQIFIGQSGNLLIAQWNNWGRSAAVAGQVITFQVQLDQVTGQIFFVYPDVIFGGTQAAANDNGLNATVGIQWANAAGSAIQYSFNQASLVDGQVISFTPNQATFSWSPATYLTATNVADPEAQNVLADITYTVTATATNGCVSAPAQVTLEANPAIQAGEAEINPDPASFCTGSDVELTAVPQGGGGPYTFTWTSPSNVTGAPSASPTLTVDEAGTWSVLIEDGCGSDATATVVVTEYAVPVASASSNSPVCVGADIELQGGSDVPGSTFAWTGPLSFSSTDEDPVIAGATLTMSGTYSVVATANGCSSAPATASVSVNVTPTAPVVVPTVWSLCPGGSVDITASSTALSTVSFNGGGVAIPAAPNSGGTGASSIGGPYPSTITVSGLPTSGVTVKRVFLNGMVHTFPDDIDILLQSPTGTNVVLMSDAGLSNDFTGENLEIRDDAAGPMSDSGVIPSGSYQCTNYGTPDNWFAPGPGDVTQATPSLSLFTGDPNGTWSLFVSDDAGGDTGNMAGWAIEFEYNNVTYTWTGAGLNTSSGPDVTATPAATTTYTVTAENNSCSASTDITVYIGNNDLTLELETDGNGEDLSYELRQDGTNALIYAVEAGTFPDNAIVTSFSCLPDGCYHLRVLDAGGDGIAGGGYILREGDGAQRRIIDNRDNFSSGAVSAIASNGAFCLPLGDDRLIFTSCDKLDWKTSPCGGEFVVANNNAAVTAQFGVTNATSGYQMWWYDPNGGYSFRRFQSHSTANGLPVSATRACHFQLNSWSGNQLQQGVVYNVKVRGRVAGNYLPWGAACRLKVDNTLAQCPATKLMDIPDNQFLSCGQTRPVGTSQASLVHARPVRRMNNNCNWVNANRYQFRFRIASENFVLVKTSATGQYFVNTNGLQPCKTYDVDVRVSFNNGSTWCVVTPNPTSVSDPAWGDVCQLTTACDLNQSLAVQPGTAAGEAAELRMYPNPNRGDQLMLSLDRVAEGVETVSVDIYDGFGKRVSARTIAVQDGFLNTVLDLNGSLANGLYMVNITAGTATFTERLVIQK